MEFKPARGNNVVHVGMHGTTPGRVYAEEPRFRHRDSGHLYFAHTNLYFRSPKIAPASLLVLDPNTLQVCVLF